MSDKVNKSYVSEVDQFLVELWKTVPRSVSQCQEETKAGRIEKLRDHVQPLEDTKEIWEKF